MKTEIRVKNVHGLRTATSVNENSGEVEHKLTFRVVMTDGDHDRLVHIFKQQVPVELLITAPSAKSDFQVQMVLDLVDKPKAETTSPELLESAAVVHGDESLTEAANREEGKAQAIEGLKAVGEIVRKHGDELFARLEPYLVGLNHPVSRASIIGNARLKDAPDGLMLALNLLPEFNEAGEYRIFTDAADLKAACDKIVVKEEAPAEDKALCVNCGENFNMAAVTEVGKCPSCLLPYAEIQPSDEIVAALKARDERLAQADAEAATKTGQEAPPALERTSEEAWNALPSASEKQGPNRCVAHSVDKTGHCAFCGVRVEEAPVEPPPSGNGEKPRRRSRKPATETATV